MEESETKINLFSAYLGALTHFIWDISQKGKVKEIQFNGFIAVNADHLRKMAVNCVRMKGGVRGAARISADWCDGPSR